MTHTQHTFDIAWDCEIQTFLQFLLDHQLKLESFIPSGPDGNPEITVSGPPHQIEELVWWTKSKN